MFASIIFFTLGSIFTKLTLLTLYLRIFKPKVWARRVIWLSIAATSYSMEPRSQYT